MAASTETIQRVLKSIMLDNPDLFWFEGKWRAVYEEEKLYMVPKYKGREDYLIRNACIEQETEIIMKSCNGSVVDNIMVVYHWILDNVQYSYSANDQTIEGVFIDKRAVCKGIAKAFQMLMNKLNIPSFLIEGTIDGKMSHVWNIVFVNEQFYHVDVTMGYQKFSGLFREIHRNKHYPCFMISDESIIVTHKIYSGRFPSCVDDFDLNQFWVDKLKISGKLQRYGSFKYLDKGSTCIVMKTSQNDLQYVLKIVEVNGNRSKYENACAELEKLKILSTCKGVVPLEDSEISKENGNVFLLQRYCKPLAIRRKEKNFNTIKNTWKLGIDILNAMLECRNKGIYHLDIQPKNIYFDENDIAILGDFGGAKFEEELYELTAGRGTRAFMAPEVYYSGVYSQASEIYSLGIVMYSLLNNAKLPFMEENDYENAIMLRLKGEKLRFPYIDNKELWNCVEKMCEFDVSKRFLTYEEAVNALKNCCI